MKPIPIYKLSKLDPATKLRLFNRSMVDLEAVKQEIKPLMAAIKNKGDKPIIAKYRSRGVPITSLAVSQKEFNLASKKVTPAFKKALSLAASNLQKVCQDQKQSLVFKPTSPLPGIKIWQKFRPLPSIGIYTPGGRANYPSSFMMSAVPAITAGVKQIIVCSPPNDKGKLPNEVLYTAKYLDIKQVFKVGGPQAIAAMSYGTLTIPRVTKIVGPGNQYVNAAKLLVWPDTAIDNPAGPSENLIIADASANPTWVAADLITDCEHGPDSTGILMTDSPALAKQVQILITKLLSRLPTRATIQATFSSLSAIIVVDSLTQAVTLANEYAPEHLQIMTRKASVLARQITAAGSVFIGPYSAKAAGDYASGANHILPTGRSARQFGPLSILDFMKLIEYQQLSRTGLNNISATVQTFAGVEGLPAHDLSVSIRKQACDKINL